MRLHELNADTLSELFAHVDVQLAWCAARFASPHRRPPTPTSLEFTFSMLSSKS